jgi:hypothetical protein
MASEAIRRHESDQTACSKESATAGKNGEIWAAHGLPAENKCRRKWFAIEEENRSRPRRPEMVLMADW